MGRIARTLRSGFSLLEMLCAVSILSILLILALNFYGLIQQSTIAKELELYQKYQKYLVINKVGECLTRAIDVITPQVNIDSSNLHSILKEGNCTVSVIVSDGNITAIEISIGDKKFTYSNEWLIQTVRKSFKPLQFIRREVGGREIVDFYLLEELMLSVLLR